MVTYRSFPYPNSYKIGTDIISSGASKITSYLIEIVVCIAGFGVTTATGTYLINMTLLVGAAMSISNQQEVTTLIAFALEGIVFDRYYRTVYVITRTWIRNHIGDGNIG